MMMISAKMNIIIITLMAITCAASTSSLCSRFHGSICSLLETQTWQSWWLRLLWWKERGQKFIGILWIIKPLHRGWLSAWNTAPLTLGKLNILFTSPHQLLGGTVLLLGVLGSVKVYSFCVLWGCMTLKFWSGCPDNQTFTLVMCIFEGSVSQLFS